MKLILFCLVLLATFAQAEDGSHGSGLEAGIAAGARAAGAAIGAGAGAIAGALSGTEAPPLLRLTQKSPVLNLEMAMEGGKSARFAGSFTGMKSKGGKFVCPKIVTVAHAFSDVFSKLKGNTLEDLKAKSADFGELAFKAHIYPPFAEKEKKNQEALAGAKDATKDAASSLLGSTFGSAAGKLVGDIGKIALNQDAAPGDVAVLELDQASCAKIEKQVALVDDFTFSVCKAPSVVTENKKISVATVNKGKLFDGVVKAVGKTTTSDKIDLEAYDVELEGQSVKQGDSGGPHFMGVGADRCIAGVQSTADPSTKDKDGYMSKISAANLTSKKGIAQFLKDKVPEQYKTVAEPPRMLASTAPALTPALAALSWPVAWQILRPQNQAKRVFPQPQRGGLVKRLISNIGARRAQRHLKKAPSKVLFLKGVNLLSGIFS